MFATIASVLRAVKQGLKNPEYRLFILAVLLIVAGGTAFYRFYEGWSWIDSVYFVVVSLLTVGYGDFQPSTELSRAVTVGFLFFGVALFGTFINLLVKQRYQHRKARSGGGGSSQGQTDEAD